MTGCCGSRRWQSLVEAGLPCGSVAELIALSDAAFDGMGRSDWLEAFAAHARIGGARAGVARDASEQAGIDGVDESMRAALEAGNAEYRARFGWVFLIRASGRSAAEMLAALRERMEHGSEEEFEVACGQEREIVTLRLEGLVTS